MSEAAKSRRDFLAVASGMLGLALIGPRVALARGGARQPAGKRIEPPAVDIRRNRTNDGFIGPFGEVRIVKSDRTMLPGIITSAGGVAEMRLAAKDPLVRIGDLKTGIRLRPGGIEIGAQKLPWNKDSIKKLLDVLKKDRTLAGGAILLRSSLHSAYPMALREFKGKPGRAMSSVMARSAKAMGAGAMTCSTTTTTERVVTTVEESVALVMSALEQWQACYAAEVVKRPGCGDLLPGMAELCAAGICTARGYVEIVVGFITIVTEIVEYVVHEVVACARSAVLIPDRWDTPWGLFDGVAGITPVVTKPFDVTKKQVDDALKLLKSLTGVFGPTGECLLAGTWSIARLQTQIATGAGPLAIPYGLRVCISAECARRLKLSAIGGDILVSWAAGIVVLAALAPAFAAAAPELVALAVLAMPGAAAVTSAIAAAVAVVGPEVALVAAVIVCMLLIVLWHITAVAAQLDLHEHFTTNFSDGVICIEHAAIALALITAVTAGRAPAFLVPPIVTG